MDSISFGDRNSGTQVGVNNGVINLPAQQPETHPEPLSTLPFPRDPDFVSRDGLLDQIHEKSSIPGSRIVLVGLGGVGKSRLAIEYCHRVRQQSPDTWLFWVHASNAARCEESLRNLADRAKVPGREDRDTNIFQLFGNWLQDGKIGSWILVLDNVDDDKLLCTSCATGLEGQATQPPLRYLLEGSNGSIIVTSRNKAVALEIAGYTKNVIDVQPMSMAEALVLIQKKLGSSTEREDLAQLVEELDSSTKRGDLAQLVEELEFMPLAIVQAASYITHRSPRCSVSQYLEKLRRSDRQATVLLNHEGRHMRRDWEAKNSILLTWKISFDHIRQTRQSAADLLSLMSFFDWQGIPEALLRVQNIGENHNSQDSSGELTDSSSKCDLEDNFESDIATLRDYSFIATSENSMVFTIHRLVQLTVRIWLKTYGRDEEWKERSIRNLYTEFPTGEYANWEKCRSLFPHIKSAVSHRPKSQDCLRIWSALLYRGAWYAREWRNIPDLREMAFISREQRMKILGAEHRHTLDSSTILAEAYEEEGRWEEAEQLFIQVLKTRKASLRANHSRTLKSMGSLALIYKKQGRWEEAEQLEVQVVETRKTKLGADHPDTIMGIVNLASTYRKQGRWEEAEQLEIQVIATRKARLGADHPDTLKSMAKLASTYRKQGRWEDAEQLEMQVLETHKTKLDADYLSTLRTIGSLALTLRAMDSLALTYRNQGRWEEAEQLDIQVIETSKTKLGAGHTSTLESMINLASTYKRQGRWEEAEQLEMQVVETRKTKLGADHPDTIKGTIKLASTYRKQGRWKEAEQLFIQVIETSKIKLSADHPDTLEAIGHLALTYRKQGRWKEAEQLEVQVVETYKAKLGDDHPSTLKSMGSLASIYKKQGRWKEAEQLEVQIMETRKTKLGADHPQTLTSMANLASTLKLLGLDADAISLLADCLTKRKQSIGLGHADTASTFKLLVEWGMEDLAFQFGIFIINP